MPTPRPWDAEYPVDTELALRLIQSQFPEFEQASAEPLGDGWDNTAFLVAGTHVFRFPRTQEAVSLTKNETRVLPWLRGRVPIAIPELSHIGQPGEGFPAPFVGYPYLPGRIASHAGLGDAERHAMASDIGRVLNALHAAPADEARTVGIGGDTIMRFAFDDRITLFRQRLDEAEQQGLLDDRAACETVIDAVDRSWKPSADTLVHGDLHSGQILIDDANALVGLIDWGDSHLGDAAVDLAGVLMLLPPAARVPFYNAYGSIDDARESAARFRGTHVAVAVILYASEIDDQALLAEARIALRNVTPPS